MSASSRIVVVKSELISTFENNTLHDKLLFNKKNKKGPTVNCYYMCVLNYVIVLIYSHAIKCVRLC